MDRPLISYEKVSKSFGTQVVLDECDLSITKGESLCIIGPSGIGKTVTIKLLVGLILPDAGDIWFDNQNISLFERDSQFLPVRQRISMVFQGAALFDSMDVFDNVAYPLRCRALKTESEIKDIVYQKLSLVGLSGTEQKMPEELSGGMKKRVGLARAIATDPEIILYDEPTAGLDPVNTVRVCDLIVSLQEQLQCTSLVVTHDIAATKRISNRAAFLFGGKIRAEGPLDELAESSDSFVRGFLQGDPSLADLAVGHSFSSARSKSK